MQEQEIRITIFYFFTIAFLILVISIVALLLYAYRKKQALHFEKENKLKTEHETQLISSRMEIHESTLTEISREIHDNLNLSLTLAKLHLNTITWTDTEQSKLAVSSSADIISKTIDDLSNLSRSLNADIIASQGLMNALEAEIERINRSAKININMHVFGKTEFLDSPKELILFRIIQESLQNIIKHADARAVQLHLRFHAQELMVLVVDDGIGYHSPQSKQHGTGITNMQARVAGLNGSFSIKGVQGKGTTITIKIPYISNGN
jgi:two-component system NarL family sensor kinase